MKILQVKKFPFYDIFLGEGWLNWTRVFYKPKQELKIMGGNPLPFYVLNKIKQALKLYATNL